MMRGEQDLAGLQNIGQPGVARFTRDRFKRNATRASHLHSQDGERNTKLPGQLSAVPGPLIRVGMQPVMDMYGT